MAPGMSTEISELDLRSLAQKMSELRKTSSKRWVGPPGRRWRVVRTELRNGGCFAKRQSDGSELRSTILDVRSGLHPQDLFIHHLRSTEIYDLNSLRAWRRVIQGKGYSALALDRQFFKHR